MIEKSSWGTPLDAKTEIPDFLTPQKTLQILTEIMKKTNKKIQEELLKIKIIKGVINMNDPSVY
jgi:hypothetical protein